MVTNIDTLETVNLFMMQSGDILKNQLMLSIKMIKLCKMISFLIIFSKKFMMKTREILEDFQLNLRVRLSLYQYLQKLFGSYQLTTLLQTSVRLLPMHTCLLDAQE